MSAARLALFARLSLPALPLLLFCAGCTKKERPADTRLVELRDAVCRCADQACVTKAVEDFGKREPSAAEDRQQLANKAVMAEITACMQNVAAIERGEGAAPATVPALPAKREADALIDAARTWQRDPRITIANIHIAYVDADGLIDGEFGEMTVRFGASTTPADDPKRKTGAPVKLDTSVPASCPTLGLQKQGWVKTDGLCPDAQVYIPKCTVTEIWRRAIAKGAPKDALASVTYVNSERAQWSFGITDGPRKVEVHEVFPDDCERVLENSP